jgi:SpoVK/Ycf46/Vps4 family AAA+-type ATPase
MTGADLTAICDVARMTALREANFARHARVRANHLDQAAARHLGQRLNTSEHLTDMRTGMDGR